jgi:hypothetical protein
MLRVHLFPKGQSDEAKNCAHFPKIKTGETEFQRHIRSNLTYTKPWIRAHLTLIYCF